MVVSRDTQPADPSGGAGALVPCPLFVGRSAELGILQAALERARAGHGGVVFIVGEAGIGKSRLIQELTGWGTALGARLLRGRAVPGAETAAFRPFAEALAPALAENQRDEALADWLPVLGAIVPTITGAGPAVEATAPVRGEAVLRLLAVACAPSGGVLVLEDLHWADPETIEVVEHLVDNLERVPVLCVASVRSEERSAARDLVRRVTARRGAEVLELARLNDAQVAAMVHSCVGGSRPDAVERAVSLAEGSPFLVEEVLVSPGLPASLADAVQARLGQLPERDRHVLLVAAAFGRYFDWRLLAAASGVSEAGVADALDRGVATQLLAVEGDGFRFRHALTAEAAFQSVIPPRREALAGAALAALDDAHGELPPELRQVGARVAERAGDPERAGHLYLAVGEEARSLGALHTAVGALERATQLLPAGDARDQARERLVDALVLAGRVDDALAIGGDVAGRLAGPRAAVVHLRLAGAASTAGRWAVVGDHLAAACALLDDSALPLLRTEIALREAELALGTNDSERAEQRAHGALAVARAEGLPEHECEALQLLGRCARRSSLESAERWFREALTVAEAHGSALWRLRSLHQIGTIALLDRSEVDTLLEAQRLAESLGAMATATVLDIEIAAGCAGLDDIDGMLRHAEQAVRRGGELGLDVVVAYGWLHRSTVALLRGNADEARAAADAARAAVPGNPDIEGMLVGSELWVALSDDDLERALVLAARMTELLRGSQTAPPGHHRAAWPVLLALAGRGEAATAIEEVEQAGVGVNRGGRGWLALAKALVAGHTDPGSATVLAVAADADLVHMPMWRSLARRIAAEAAARDGWSIPEGWLPEAESCLRSLGYTAAADACRRLRGGGRATVPPEWARLGITRRESEVLTLVVEGCANREIAGRLHLSVRTVEKHVESLLRKTDTRSRTQLARLATTT